LLGAGSGSLRRDLTEERNVRPGDYHPSGNVAVATFFARRVLPHLSADRKAVEAVDPTVMDMTDAAF
jgi:hypothetical protein